MEYEALMALIADGGGFDNVVRLIFDNSIHTSFVMKPEEARLKKDDFVQLGGTWFFKEASVTRSKDTYDYDVPMVVYHPLECLQAVVMCDQSDRIDILSMTDMLAQNSATG